MEPYLALIKMQNRQRGATSEGLRWEREGGMSSGVPDTSVNNSVINATAHLDPILNAVEKSGCDPLDLENHLAMAVLGDDNFIIMSSQLRGLIEGQGGVLNEFIISKTQSLGLRPELKIHTGEFAKAEFCSGWFNVSVDQSGEEVCCWTPKVGRVLCKTFAVKVNEKNPDRIIRGMALGYLHLPLCPLLMTAAETLDHKLSGVDPVYSRVCEYDIHKGSRNGGKRIKANWDDCLSFMERYDLSPDEVDEVRQYVIGQLSKNEWPLDLRRDECPAWDKIMDIDVPNWSQQRDMRDTSRPDLVSPNTTFNDPWVPEPRSPAEWELLRKEVAADSPIVVAAVIQEPRKARKAKSGKKTRNFQAKKKTPGVGPTPKPSSSRAPGKGGSKSVRVKT